MSVSHTDRLALHVSHGYEGEARGIRFICGAARYASGKMALTLQRLTDTGGMKGAADRLAEALNGKWTHRDRGYLLAPSRATLWRALFVAGWDAGMDWRRSAFRATSAPLLESPDGRKMTLKQAAGEIKRH